MMRSLVALALSLLVHIVALMNLALPVAHPASPISIRVRIANPIIAETPKETPSQPAGAEILAPDRENVIAPADGQDSIPDVGEHPAAVQTDGASEPGDVAEASLSQGESVTGGFGDGGQGDRAVIGDSSGGSGDPSAAAGGGQGSAEGPAVDTESIVRDYAASVLAAISEHKTYPATARRLEQEGDVRIRFNVASDGTVSSTAVESSSGVASLDAAALQAVADASPVPPIPAELGVDSLTLSLLIVFNLD